jgi:hypothetical protein
MWNVDEVLRLPAMLIDAIFTINPVTQYSRIEDDEISERIQSLD